MLDGTGSSHQEEVLLRVDGLAAGPSLNCDDTLLSLEWRSVSGRSTRSDVRVAMRWRHSSWKVRGDNGGKTDLPKWLLARYSSSFHEQNNSCRQVMCLSVLLGAESCKRHVVKSSISADFICPHLPRLMAYPCGLWGLF